MNVKIKKTKRGMKIKPVGKEAFPITTKTDYPKAHFLITAFGKRGSGKTTSITSLINEGVRDKVWDEVFIITPTYWSNEAMFLQFGDAFDPETNWKEPLRSSADDIENFVQSLADYYDDYLDEMEMYEELKNKKKSELDLMDLEYWRERGIVDDDGFIIKPDYKYHNKPPRCVCLVDDAVGTDCYIGLGGKKMTSLALKHRHIAPMRHGGVLGVSLCLLAQSIATSQGGIPKAVRENSTHTIIVGKTKDESRQKKMYEELGDGLTQEQFMGLWDYACPEEEPHSFLFLDYNPKDKGKKYRKNFDEYLEIKGNEINLLDKNI
jgi:hypothetical protein